MIYTKFDRNTVDVFFFLNNNQLILIVTQSYPLSVILSAWTITLFFRRQESSQKEKEVAKKQIKRNPWKEISKVKISVNCSNVFREILQQVFVRILQREYSLVFKNRIYSYLEHFN